MKIILLQDVKKIGKKHQIVDVASGYAHNNLIPKKLAIPATHENEQKLKQKIDAVVQHDEKERQHVVDNLKILSRDALVIQVKSSDKGSLYAKLHAKEIVDIIQKEKKITIAPVYIMLAEPISEIGTYAIKISAFQTEITLSLVVEKEK